MKELSLDRMDSLNGGSWWADSICEAVMIGDIVSEIGVELSLVAAASGPVAWAIIGANIACYAYSKHK